MICKKRIIYINLHITTSNQHLSTYNIYNMGELEYFKNRRTVRQYTDKDISDKLLTELIEAASHAPTTGNMQLYSVIVTHDEDNKRRLAPAHFNQPCLMSAKVVLTFCADFNRFVKWCGQRKAQPGFNNLQAWLWAVEDTMIFAQQLVTLAEMHGLGTCYLGTTSYNAAEIARTLGLPDMVVPVITVTVGYPATMPDQPDRLPVEAIMHRENYKDYSSDDIDRIFAEKENRDDSRRFITENGKETLAQVFTDVRYPRADNEHFSKAYHDFIREKGFKF